MDVLLYFIDWALRALVWLHAFGLEAGASPRFVRNTMRFVGETFATPGLGGIVFVHAATVAVAAGGAMLVARMWRTGLREAAFLGRRETASPAAADRLLLAGAKGPAAADPTPPAPEAARPAEFQSANSSPAKLVDVTAFAPPAVQPGDEFYLQVVMHAPAEADAAKARARALEPTADVVAAQPLAIPLRKGDDVKVTVHGDGAEVVDPVHTFAWQEHLAHICFVVRVPRDSAERFCRPLVRVFVNGAPAAILKAGIEVRRHAPDVAPGPVTKQARQYRRAFLSYASEDRPKVLRTAQVLRALGIDYFQDVLSLSPGQRWERELHRAIDDCDAFILFWSSHARESEWVLRECMLARERRHRSDGELPEILPIIVEGPPIVEPPTELGDLHFNDPLQSLIYAEETARQRGERGVTAA